MNQACISRIPSKYPGNDTGEEYGVRIMAVTSGKGGVGKTSVVANLACSLSLLGRKVLVFDGNMGMGNVDVLLGLKPRYTLVDVMAGRRRIQDVLLDGPAGIRVLPASCGMGDGTALSSAQKADLLSQVEALEEEIDFLLIDTAAGIAPDVMFFNAAAHEVVIVVSPEPTSITDAYALMKRLSEGHALNHFQLLVNTAGSEAEAKGVYRKLCAVVDQFLPVSLGYLGFILWDPAMMQAVRKQKAAVEIFPDAEASRCFRRLAREIVGAAAPASPGGNVRFFWQRVFHVA